MNMVSPARLDAHVIATVPTRNPRVRLPYCLKKGANLFREGDACSGLFQVVSGVFRLSRLTRSGQRYVVGFGFAGDILGYGPDLTHISDCDAITAAKVIRHRPDILNGGRNEGRNGGLNEGRDPALQEVLLKGALRQIEAMQDHCVMLGRNNACDRVAAFLSLLGDRLGRPLGPYTEFELPMSRADIADYLGLTTETISRSLTELRHEKLIEIRNIHQIVLLRPQILEARAEQAA